MKHTEINLVIQSLIHLGYEIDYRDGDRYVSLQKMFGNSDADVNGSDDLQIGRIIELCNGNVVSKAYMKRGWLWSGSAYTQQHKNNVYAIGGTRKVASYNHVL
jgi:hypothetical protein